MKLLERGQATQGFKSISQLKYKQNKTNRTEKAFLPESLRGAVRAEAGFPISSISGNDSQNMKFPSIKGMRTYGDEYGQSNDDASLRSQSQISLAISQKRGDRIVKQNMKQLEQLQQTPRLSNEMRVTSIEPTEEGMLNLKIQEDESVEQNTMNFGQPEEDIEFARNMGDPGDDSGFEEGDPDDYNLNGI